MGSTSRVVLVTGCSSGIGAATAALLASKGWKVYATARRRESLKDLEAKGCKTLSLDVTNEASRREAVAAVEAAEGAVGVLINNAGFSQSGAVETVPDSRVRAQFDTNVFGPLDLTRLVLPGMRRQGWGKVVNVSSMGGRFVFPGAGLYHASKYAIEALSDALRWEVAGFGVDVILIEPGIIKTGFSEVTASSIGDVAATAGPYRDFNNAVADASKAAYTTGITGALGGPAESVARAILRAISARRPKTRYPVTASAHVFLALRALVSDRMWDRMLNGWFPRPGGGTK